MPALLGVREIFGTDLPQDPRFVAAASGALRQLYADGAKRTVTEITQLQP